MALLLDRREWAPADVYHAQSASAALTAARVPLGVQVLLAVFVVSNALFLGRALATPWLSAACLAGMGVGLALLFRHREPLRAVDLRWSAICLLLALGVSVLGGAGHLTFAPEDWSVRDAVLGDLARGGWPVLYDWDGRSWLLRAPLGFYEIPAAIGSRLGLGAAHLAVLVQNTVVLAAVLAIVAQEAKAGWRRLTLVAVLLLFSGLDIVGMAKAWALARAQGEIVPFPMHIERWAGDLEYSSTLTGLFWAPNHCLPALAFVAVFLCWRRGECSSAGLAAVSALTFFWSPLAAVGMAPFVLLALYRGWRAREIRPWALLAAGAVGAAVLPIVLFLHLGSGTVPHGWLFDKPGYLGRYAVFGLHEILPALYLMWRAGHGAHSFRKSELLIASAVLVILPLYMVGASNDLMMRASTVALTIAALVIGQRLIACIDAGERKPAVVIGVVLAIGAVTPALQIGRALTLPAAPPVTLNVRDAWNASPFSWASPDTYRAPVDSLDPWRWLFKPSPAEPALQR